MATHSSVLAWRIQGRGSLVGCRLWGHKELDMPEVAQLAAAASLPGTHTVHMRYIYVNSCLENPMNKMKRQKETTVVDVSGGESKI